uniref:DLEC1 cilia and flagella associated protein n=1 Tax=Maylandia zebra TaxID=106582 RepID=A0A3P9CWD3_9CICH
SFVVSQNISHVLASIFKHLYTNDIIRKDTVSNLVQTKRVRGSYHDRYVEELQQVIIYTHLQLVDMLDNHMIQASACAAAKENQAYERMKATAGDVCDHQELLTGEILLKTLKTFKNITVLYCSTTDCFLSFTSREPVFIVNTHNAQVRLCLYSYFESPAEEPIPVFLAKPSVVVFTDYSVGNIYEVCFRLKNVTSSSRHIRVIPPTTPYFSIGLGRFPGEGGVVAPGMSCKYTLRFAPDSLGDYKDFIVVETQAEGPFVVPIEAWRPPPILTCMFSLLLSFCAKMWASALGPFSLAKTYFSEQPPFAVSPSLFVLEPGEATVVEVSLDLKSGRKSCQVFTVVCDNCQVKDISIEGEGQLIALELVSVSGGEEPPVVGEVHDLTAEHFIRFSPCNPHSVQQKKLVIRNNVHLELPFHWQIMKPNLHPLLPRESPDASHIQFHLATDEVFHVSPSTGILAPCQDQEYLLIFCPKELKDYHSVCHLVLRDIPQLPPEPSDSSVIIMEIEVKGSTEPYQILLEPYAIVIPGEIFICTPTSRQFKMWNHSKTFICFQWERINSSCHVIEVEPSSGRIEENECFDFSLTVTGGKAENIVTSLVCHIQHHHEPVTLAVEVSFKGPTVTLNVPSIDFGPIRPREQTQTTLLLTNTTQLEASWILERKLTVHSISVEPSRGLLPPLASCNVDVLFKPHSCQLFETELELTVENGTGCHLSVRADVQSSHVCLLNCTLSFPELYVGASATGTVTLFNQTLLPSQFSWLGKQASLCSATFDPSSGTLGPKVSMEITVTFTAHTDLELTEVAAVCEVQGMNSPLVVGIVAKPKKLSVSYNTEKTVFSRSSPNGQSPSTPVLEFGDGVILKSAVSKQLLITNQTAIPAPFTVEAEYFTCHALKNKELTLFVCSLPEFVSSLLAHGKGAAFFVTPHTGTLGAFESRAVDVTAYTDMWGEYTDHLICKVGDLKPVLIPIHMTVKGCPLYFQMTGPRAQDQNQGPIIQFGTHVSGGDTVSRSLRINNPTMFDIRLDWETYNVDQNDGKLLDFVVVFGDAFPLKDADGNEVLSSALRLSSFNETAWEKTRTTVSEETSASLQSLTKKLISVHIRPHMGNLSDYPFCITPQQIVIPAKSSRAIHVSFTPLTLSGAARKSRCVGLALGFMNLDSEVSCCDSMLNPGKCKHAHMRCLSQVNFEQSIFLFFLQIVVREFDITQSFQLKNTSEMPLHFSLGTQPPFSVVKPKPRGPTSTSRNPPSGDNQSLVLKPQHSMRVKVAFHCSLPLLDHVEQTDEEIPPGVKLIHGANGQMKLRFEQNLLIHYSNNTLQTVPLCAHLDLPTLRLSAVSVDFGLCYVGQTQTREVNLYSCGAHMFWKSITSNHKSISNLYFSTLLVIRSPLIKTSVTLQLRGTGSFDEMSRSS